MMTNKIELIPDLKNEKIPEKKILGYEIIPSLYCNIYIFGKPGSGKTNLIYNILKKCADEKTIVIFFVPTIETDKSYQAIVKYLKKNNIYYIREKTFSSIDENGHEYDQLQNLLNYLRENSPDLDIWEDLDEMNFSSDSDEEKEKIIHRGLRRKEIIKIQNVKNPESDSSDEEVEEIIKYYRQKISPEFIFVIDDNSTEIKRSKSLESLLKTYRHLKAKVIVATQSVGDLFSNNIAQSSFIILFPNLPKDKLEKIWKVNSLSISFDDFLKKYKRATENLASNKNDNHNFLMIDVKNEIYKKNFSEII